MSEWICPDCGGGFPTLKNKAGREMFVDACPWCGKEMEGPR